MPTLFDPTAYQGILQRLDTLQPTSPRQWGKMKPGQAMEHLARALDMGSGRTPTKQALIGKLLSWMARGKFLGPDPFPRDQPTAPSLVVSEEPNFAATRDRLKQALAHFASTGEKGCDGNIHIFFGRCTGAEWGITQWKHLDHHLRQFGV